MRSLLRVAALALIGTAAMSAAATTAHASPGSPASPGGQASGISFAIDSINPQAAKPNSTVVVTGTLTNGTSSALSGLSVQLYSSQAWFQTRDNMDAFVAGSASLPLTAEGNADQLTASVRPGGTVTWRAQFSIAASQIAQFGVYPLQADLTDLAGTTLAHENTLLPFWTGSTTGISKLKIAWVWPLIDQPHRQACTALTSNSLAPSLAGSGRLNTLLTAGAADPQANLTWAIDPALLGDASTMTRPYQVPGPSWTAKYCQGAAREPASSAATTWLATLKTATAGQPVVITPYGNTDVSALVHQGLNSDLASAYQLGKITASGVLTTPFSTNLALPAGGQADQSVLTTLATSEHVSSVVLSSSEMPPATAGYNPDDAVTSIRTMAGTPMNVLLADDSLTSLLNKASGNSPAGAQFAVAQQFLAETAMIVSEAPESARSVVVSPPPSWAPSLALAESLLRESSAPWLQPVTLHSLAGSHDSATQVIKRQPPPDTKIVPGELGRGYLATVGSLGSQLGMLKSMLDQASAGYTRGLDETLAATESAAWRGAGSSGGQALVDGLAGYLKHAQGSVKIITSAEITMAGSSGVVPVTIQNNMLQNVQVKLSAIVPVAKGAAPPLTVAEMPDVITIPARQIALEKLHVSSAPSGTTVIQLYLTSADGERLPQTQVPLSVHSTRYGQAILFLIAGAIGLLVLSSLFRAGRRWLGDGAHSASPDPASPGNVMAGAQDPTEAPDDLADARRWADDT